MTEEHKRNIGLANKGKVRSPEHRKRVSEAQKGRKQSPELIARRIAAVMKTRIARGNFSGIGHPNYRDGKTPLRKRLYNTARYKSWRKAVFERDKYTCQFCGQVGGVLNADHIKRFAEYPELRFELSNGRTLCESCHRTTDTYGYKSKVGTLE